MPGERILVIDDAGPVREVVCAILKNASYRYEQACSGVEALQILRDDRDFQLVLTDLVMPDVDGVGVLKTVTREYDDLPVVMVTAIDDISVALSAIRNGAFDYLLKPFTRDELIEVVRRGLEANRRRVEDSAYHASLESLANQRATELRAATQELERSHDATLEALGCALDLKDAETNGHSKRVTTFTIRIARALGLDPPTINMLARGAFLHDIGKMAISDTILKKSTELNIEEKLIMQTHSNHGYRMLLQIPFLAEIAHFVYAHHENWDGTGYPRGLKGVEIPLGSRIFAIADTLDAMTSRRPYRDACSVHEARHEIAACAGQQFDPLIVNVFLSIPVSVWEHDVNSDSRRNALLA